MQLGSFIAGNLPTGRIGQMMMEAFEAVSVDAQGYKKTLGTG